jgi:hypothetical protein
VPLNSHYRFIVHSIESETSCQMKSNAKLVAALAFKSSDSHPSRVSEYSPRAAKFAMAKGASR